MMYLLNSLTDFGPGVTNSGMPVMACSISNAGNVVLQYNTFKVMFYRQQRSLWFHFSNFEHFLRPEIMMFGQFITGQFNVSVIHSE